MADRRYIVEQERVEHVAGVVIASSKREAARIARDGGFDEEWGPTDGGPWPGKILSVEREEDR